MKVDFVARYPHFIDHLAPIYRALPQKNRGLFYTRRLLCARARYRGVVPHEYGKKTSLVQQLKARGNLVVITGFADLQITAYSGRPHIWCEHGAGFTFSNNHPSFVGSNHGREAVCLFLCPSETSARLQRQACPWARAVAIGCPKLDLHHQNGRKKWIKTDHPRIAISFHFDSHKSPETRSAFSHFRRILPELASRYELIGHSHPHMAKKLSPIYHQLGVQFVEDFDDVIDMADLYICDASSTLYEFASVGKPVVVLNAPWYRRHINHEGNPRFWSYADVGVQVDEPEQLMPSIMLALEDRPEQKAARERAVRACYFATDGHASERAAAMITALFP